jgi:hypothetical protein
LRIDVGGRMSSPPSLASRLSIISSFTSPFRDQETLSSKPPGHKSTV